MYQFDWAEIQKFGVYLQEQERAPKTVQKYLRDLEQFYLWLPNGKQMDKSVVISYKNYLTQTHTPGGVNTILAALNGFFRFQGWQDCVVKTLRIQRRVFSDPNSELSKEEYFRLVETARKKNDAQMELLLQLMASTGIRVSEIQYVTAEALEESCIQIWLKGKIRTILLPGKLNNKLHGYQLRQGITAGPIFLTKKGYPLDRRIIWRKMKGLCAEAGILESKVFPHNLRHLFARSFYECQNDIVKLADVLGHSSIETTRIYLLSSGQEHQRILENLHLLL